MQFNMFRRWLTVVCVVVAGVVSLQAQDTNAPATNAPSTNAPAATAPVAIAPGDIVSQAQADTSKLQEYQTSLKSDPVLQGIAEKLPGIAKQIDGRIKEDAQLLVASPSLNNLQISQISWQTISDDLAEAQKNLSARVQQLDQLLYDLSRMDTTWKATLSEATKSNTPAEIIAKIKSLRTLNADTTKAVQGALAPIYSMQNRVAAQDVRSASGLVTINTASTNARGELFKQNHPPLWDSSVYHPLEGSVVVEERASLNTQLSALHDYLKEKFGAFLIHLFLVAVLIMGFVWMRRTIHARVADEPALEHTAQVLEVPLATAFLLAFLATPFLYPQAPRILIAIIGAGALFPAVIVIRRLIEPANYPILYATIIAFLTDRIRHLAAPAGVATRVIFVAELLAVCIFLLVTLRSKHLAPETARANPLMRWTRVYLHIAYLVFVFSGLANAFGYADLSVLTGEAMLKSSYVAVILYATVRIVDALAMTALSVRPLTALGMVRRHQELIYNNVKKAVRWLFFLAWLLVTLHLFTLLEPVWTDSGKILNTQVDWFFISFKIGAVFAFPITVWASFLLSRLIRFVLQEEVYPHLTLGRGVPYAASTMVHYVVLLIGFFAAIAATGAPLSQFSFLAGAFGVGLGFGLQNIFNNFVSGIILLFERPIKVGDTIQIGTDIGVVERIGIRASVVQLGNGSELIVPNGNLIANPVTNWTLTNCERVVEIPVSITSKVDPRHVMDVLTSVAQNHPQVLKNPPPRALLTSPGGLKMTFRLRVWTDSEDEWMSVTSDLSLAINDALAKENITMA